MDEYELLEELEKLTDINHQLAERIAELEKAKTLTDEEKKQIAKEYLQRHLLYVVTEEIVDDFQLQNVVVSDFDFKRNQWIEDNKEKIEEALEWDLKQRQPMQILDDGRIVPIFKTLTDEEIKQLYENSFDWDKRNLWTFNYNDFAKAILRKAQEK